jgi:hypothetical protein
VNDEASGTTLYSNVELAIRRHVGRCDTTTPCLVATPDPNGSLDDYELWTRYRLGPDDAAEYARLVANMLEPVCPEGSGPSGMANVTGDVWMVSKPNGAKWLYVSPKAGFLPIAMAQRAGTFVTISPWRMGIGRANGIGERASLARS